MKSIPPPECYVVLASSAPANQPDFMVMGRSLSASRTACLARSRVESSTGSGALADVMMRGISVHPRMTHSAPFDRRSSIAWRNRFVVSGRKMP